MRAARLVLAALLSWGCSGENGVGAHDCNAPSRRVNDRCLAPGVADDGCPAGTLATAEGQCAPAGIATELCAEGFTHDGVMRCEPVLPPVACDPGTMAIPGEPACRPIMACGAGRWGDIVVEATTEHVDGSYAGSDSDGSAERPWPTIAQAVAAAAPGAIVAIAAGSYSEDVVVYDKALRLWGVCPERVEIAGTSPSGAISVLSGGSGSELRGMAVRGAVRGLGISDAVDVVIDRLWIHDTGSRGIEANPSLGPVSLRITDTLVERARGMAIYLSGARAEIERSVLRATQLDGAVGWGLNVQIPCDSVVCDPSIRSDVRLSRSVIEQSHDAGITTFGSDVVIEGTVVRDTQPSGDGTSGVGIEAAPACTEMACAPGSGTALQLRSSIVERCHETGIAVGGSTAEIEGTLIRDIYPQPADRHRGRGINVQPACLPGGCDLTQRSHATVRASVVERVHDGGIVVNASDATITSTVIQDVAPRLHDGVVGSGIAATLPCGPNGCPAEARPQVDMLGSVIERVHFAGLLVVQADVTMKATAIGHVAATVEGFGDGITVVTDIQPATAAIESCAVIQAARAGIASFGADVSLASTKIECAQFDLEGEIFAGSPFRYRDEGHNACGCPVAVGACEAVSADLAPPPFPE